MDTVDYDPALHTSDKGDASLYVQFYMHFVKNETTSKVEGRAMYDDVPFTKIFTPGDRTNIIDRPTRESDKIRFPVQWSRFNNAQEQRADGTPLAEWPIVTRGQAEELKYLGFTTVEQIAGMKDGINYMGAQDLKRKAQVYLETAKGNTAPVEQMMEQMREMAAQMSALKESHDVIRAENKALREASKHAA